MRDVAFCMILGVALLARGASAGKVEVVYRKALGQMNQRGTPVLTAGGRLAIDSDGNIYCGTPGGNSFLQKLAPDGRVLWQHFYNVPGFQGTAVDDKFLYTCGSGYYGWRQVMRWDRETGAEAPGWQLQWKGNEYAGGVRPMSMPAALLVDERHLYVADVNGDEVRRLDKQTGKEAPMRRRLVIAEPRDLARSPQGHILVLTPETVVEADREGELLRVPLIKGLVNPVAMETDARAGRIYVAEGGVEGEPVNSVREFDAEGNPTGRQIGAGGSFQGKWSPDKFAFSEGTGDLALAPDGGLWVNPGWSHKLMFTLPALHYFNADGTLGRTLCGVGDNRPLWGIAVGENLDCYVSGQLKLNWDGQIAWTSGLVRGGSVPDYPAAHSWWPTLPVLCAGRLIVYTQPDGAIFELDRLTGRSVAGLRRLQAGCLICSVGQSLFLVSGPEGTVYCLPPMLEAEPDLFWTLPEQARGAATGLDLSDDLARVFIVTGKVLRCFQVPDGKLLWEAPAAGQVVWHRGLVYAGKAEGMGLQVLDAESGAVLAAVADQAADDRAPVSAADAFNVAESEGRAFLFVHAPGAVRVYEVLREGTQP